MLFGARALQEALFLAFAMHMSILRRQAIKTLIRAERNVRTMIDALAIAEEKGLHPKHRLTRYYSFFLENITPDNKVLDIGCGNGYVASRVAEKAKLVAAIDISKKNIEYAKRKFSRKNISFFIGDATSYNFKEKFDCVILSNVLEHIRERHLFLIKIKQLAPKILIRVPMINRDWLVFYKRELGLPYMCDKTHFTEYTLESFCEEIKAAELEIQSYSICFGEIWAALQSYTYENPHNI